jgi:hypothetical protein
VSQQELEEAALRLPGDERIALVDRLYRQVNHPLDRAAREQIRLADDRRRVALFPSFPYELIDQASRRTSPEEASEIRNRPSGLIGQEIVT